MLDIRAIAANPEVLSASLKKRGAADITEELLQNYQQYKLLIGKQQELEGSLNSLAKDIGTYIKNGQDVAPLKQKVTDTKQVLEDVKVKVDQAYCNFNDMLLRIPNILDEGVPLGTSEADNKEIKKFLEPAEFDFIPKSHQELGEVLGILDIPRAVKLSGSRFSVLNSSLARLERALVNFMLDQNIKEGGFKERSVPVIVNEEALVGTSQLPKFADDMFALAGTGKWLISTAEISLTNLYREENLQEADLPLRLTAATPCFRKEAGARGKDTKGILRQHQFTKVEMVSLCTPNQANTELEHLLSSAERILQLLKLPYRVVLLCSGDTGFSARKTYDIEVWLPSQNTYREISSCSLCGDFQARRMNTKFVPQEASSTKVKPSFVHTLNGSALAVGRTIVAIMENYQTREGHVKLPEVLVPYMQGATLLSK